jgi:hypothetical protein
MPSQTVDMDTTARAIRGLREGANLTRRAVAER